MASGDSRLSEKLKNRRSDMMGAARTAASAAPCGALYPQDVATVTKGDGTFQQLAEYG